MPRTYGKPRGKAKQTRLSFVPAEFTSDKPDNQDEDTNSRNANVRYSHPSLSSLRAGRSTGESKANPTPSVKDQPSPEETVQSEGHASQRRSRRKGKSMCQFQGL